MSNSNKIDKVNIEINDVMLASFVDDQLDAINREAIIKAMDEDNALREKVYNLRKMKDLMKLSFGDAKPPETSRQSLIRPLRSQCMKRIAAVFAAMVIGLGAGFTGYKYCTHDGYIPAHSLAELTQQQDERIILHISESDPVQFETTLAYTEKFLKKYRKNGKAQIEVVANAGGIDLLRADYPLSNKVQNMMDNYDNITFIACTNAINRLRAQGIDPSIVKDVDTDKAALTHIIERLNTGWTYIKADSDMLKI
jgi:intracellular sulfur oxidation DsrE/DsrF family protein